MSRSQLNVDRFIPNRSAMDFDFAGYMLTQGGRSNYPPDNAFRKLLADSLGMTRTRILAFRDQPSSAPAHELEFSCVPPVAAKPKPRGRRIPQTQELKLDAPDLADDYSLNLLDWGSSNIVAIALDNTVYLWNAATRNTSELATFDDETGPVTSVSWSPEGRHIAIGLNSSQVELWDSTCNRNLRTWEDCHHSSRVGSLAWNNHILTSGGMDGCIVSKDVRVRSPIVNTYSGHRQEVCGLKWSPSGLHLASGGDDNLVNVWDRRSAAPTQWLHRFDGHTAAVRALAWCPFEDNLLASGGGDQDGCIKFWHTRTGACLNSVDTGSAVCSLLWNNNQRELLSSHGPTHNQLTQNQLPQNQLTQNQLTLWKYPSMCKIAELTGHTSRVLYMAQSPNGCTVASAAGGDDESLRLWNAFGDPKLAKAARRPEPFADYPRIR